MKKLLFIIVVTALIHSCGSSEEGPYLATGIKIGEVTQSTAIIWTRLTKYPERISDTAPMPTVKYIDDETKELIDRGTGRKNLEPVVIYPEGYSVDNIAGAVPGKDGKVSVKYRKKGEANWDETEWTTVDPEKAYTHQFQLSGLNSGTDYELIVEASPLKGRRVSASIEGSFTTAPSPEIEKEIHFIVTTGTSYPDVDSEDGYKFYMSALKLHPDFFVHTGDIVYYDELAKTDNLARWHWDRMYSFPNNIEFHSKVPSYFIKDDHDTWMNDCYPGMKTRFMGDFTYEEGTAIFLYEVPMGEKTYRTVRWGKDLQVWFVEGRDFRSQNTMEDGPGKTIWGKEQMDWFKRTVKESDATFRVLVSPTPIVGPDRAKGKNDNYSNKAFQYEGDLVRDFISSQKNMYTVCGDRHWQYVSKDIRTGLIEASCGPGSDAHAGGWSQDDVKEEHIYLNVCGGFLEVEVSRESGEPQLIFRHHNPDGAVLNEYVCELVE